MLNWIFEKMHIFKNNKQFSDPSMHSHLISEIGEGTKKAKLSYLQVSQRISSFYVNILYESKKSKTLPLLWYLLFSVFHAIKIFTLFSGLLLFPVISDWPHHKLLEKTLYLQVIDYDRFSRDDPIGEITLPLNEVDLTQKKSTWRFLEPCKESRVSWYLYSSKFWES